jgi:subfamily B ATP-binding cassette protein MsbA
VNGSFAGIRVLKTYGQEDFESARFQQNNKGFVRNAIKAGQVDAATSPLLEFIGGLGILVTMWYGGYLVIAGDMTPGAFFSFLTAMLMAYPPIRHMASANNTLQQAMAAAERVFTILDMEDELARDRGRKTLPPISRELEFRHVGFSYEGTHEPALTDINLTIKVGEVVALVGPSGSGKTTLANLIPRFYDPSTGALLIDGHDVREFTLRSLRSQIGIVSQDAFLFDDTVKNNIAYSRIDASDDLIRAAARTAYALEFIDDLPQGFDTMVGENGMKLSGGQRQRIMIARAVLRNPPILIFDEATSSLDSESERIVQLALSNLIKDRTTLVIAHRLSTILQAHRIAVLSAGTILDSGNHHELIDRCTLYRKLYDLQFQDPLSTMRKIDSPSVRLSSTYSPEGDL